MSCEKSTKTYEYDMVIARYSEKLEWLNNVNLERIGRIFIYNKNSKPFNINSIVNTFKDKKITITNLPNVGREAHTYLYHLITHYDDLSEKIIFTQGCFDDHNNKYDDFFSNDPFVRHEYFWILKDFRMKYWQTELRPNKNNFGYDTWAKTFIEKDMIRFIDPYLKLSWGACFSVSRENCFSRPINYYKQLMKLLDDHFNPEDGHFFERSWYYIFNGHKQPIRDNPDHVVVGAGLAGAVIAEKLASFGHKVLIVEKRKHLGGNCYDEICEETGILVSKYGAHIFHTNDVDVWEYVNKFSDWTDYNHKVYGKTEVDGKYFPIPINIETVNTLCGKNIKTKDEMQEYIESVRDKTILDPKNSEEYCLSRFGRQLYELVVRDYTFKQWGKYPNELDVSVLQRIPLRYDNFNGYFTDKYQALPKDGYTKFISNILDHPNILVLYNTDYNEMKSKPTSQLMTWYTGPIDTYFKESGLPKLEYRSVNFDNKIIKNTKQYQPYPVVNYTKNNVDYTRIVEHKHFLKQESPHTYISFERTTDNGDPYYPVPNERNMKLYEQYKKLASDVKSNVTFVGRLASYKYYNMDQAIINSLNIVSEYIDEYKKVHSNEKIFMTTNNKYMKTNIFSKKYEKKQIKIRAVSDAHLGLAIYDETNQSNKFIEIVLGGWFNTKSCIRFNRQGKDEIIIDHFQCDVMRYIPIVIEYTDDNLFVYDENNNILMRAKYSFKNVSQIEFELASWDRICDWIIIDQNK